RYSSGLAIASKRPKGRKVRHRCFGSLGPLAGARRQFPLPPNRRDRVLVATKPVDFRKGMDGLAALVKEQLKTDPFSGVIFCFRSKRADRVKLIFWDGTGLCLFAKRLEGGKSRWPRIEDGVMRL